MTLGKSIRIYLKEGSVTGIKFAELVNQTIQALSCPRSKIVDLNAFFYNEINTQGVYFLLGYEEDTLRQVVYVGEAENVWDRLKNHDSKKDFWNEVIVFTSKDDNLTKSHIKYLESRIVQIAIETRRYGLKNSNSPTLSSLPLPDKDAMEEFLSNVKLLTGTLGHKFLENPLVKEISETSEADVNKINTDFKQSFESHKLSLTHRKKKINAQAVQSDEGLVVLKGSDAIKQTSKNFAYGTLRESLLQEGVLVESDSNNLKFIQDYLFSSVSAAAAVILGYSVNGRDAWKNSEGQSINQIEEKKLK